MIKPYFGQFGQCLVRMTKRLTMNEAIEVNIGKPFCPQNKNKDKARKK